jgi:hypothetical protein
MEQPWRRIAQPGQSPHATPVADRSPPTTRALRHPDVPRLRPTPPPRPARRRATPHGRYPGSHGSAMRTPGDSDGSTASASAVALPSHPSRDRRTSCRSTRVTRGHATPRRTSTSCASVDPVAARRTKRHHRHVRHAPRPAPRTRQLPTGLRSPGTTATKNACRRGAARLHCEAAATAQARRCRSALAPAAPRGPQASPAGGRQQGVRVEGGCPSERCRSGSARVGPSTLARRLGPLLRPRAGCKHICERRLHPHPEKDATPPAVPAPRRAVAWRGEERDDIR